MVIGQSSMLTAFNEKFALGLQKAFPARGPNKGNADSVESGVVSVEPI